MAPEPGRDRVTKGLPMLLHMASQRNHARAFTRAYLSKCRLQDSVRLCNSETLGRCHTCSHQESCRANGKSSVTTCYYITRTYDEGMIANDVLRATLCERPLNSSVFVVSLFSVRRASLG